MSDLMRQRTRDVVSLDSPAFAHLLEGCERNGVPYMHAFDTIREFDGTVGDALDKLGVSRADIEMDLVTLERKDAAQAMLLDGGPVTTSERVGAGDQRQVGSSTIGRDDPTVAVTPAVYEQVHAQPANSARYFQASRIVDSYNDANGPARWSHDDRQAASSGVDLLRTLQAHQSQSRTAQTTRTAARRLDAAMKAKTPAKRRKLLDEAIADGHKLMSLDTAAQTGSGPPKMSKRARKLAKAVNSRRPKSPQEALVILDQIAGHQTNQTARFEVAHRILHQDE